MDLTSAGLWRPPADWTKFTVIETHTGGEPFRVVVDGLPTIPGDTVLARRRFAMENLDHLRRALMWEPRGHADMYGGWLGEPVEEDSDFSILFIHNDGFSTMCGHGIIAICKLMLDVGLVDVQSPETTVRIDTPAGQVTAIGTVADGRVETVRFLNVKSFASDLDASVEVPGHGQVRYDLGFGGAFYAYVEAASAGVDLDDSAQLIAAGRAIKTAVNSRGAVEHPVEPDLSFLYGVIFTGAARDPANHSRNVCVFADGEIDRSPTGTGLSGRLAILEARGELGAEETIRVESIVGSVFKGRIAEKTSLAGLDAVIPEISGSAHIVGVSELWLDPDDPLNPGFFVR